jgi:Kef-type K+ transport system membrane component KefB
MEHADPVPPLPAHVHRLRNYRQLSNTLTPLLVIAAALLAFRWVFPWLFSRLVFVWSADAVILLILAIPWLVVSCAFAFGKIKCPACLGGFTSGFHLFVPKACHGCGYDVTIPRKP